MREMATRLKHGCCPTFISSHRSIHNINADANGGTGGLQDDYYADRDTSSYADRVGLSDQGENRHQHLDPREDRIFVMMTARQDQLRPPCVQELNFQEGRNILSSKIGVPVFQYGL